MDFRSWCMQHFPGGTFTNNGDDYSCKNHFRDEKNASLSFSDSKRSWNDFALDEGGRASEFCREHGLQEWDGGPVRREGKVSLSPPAPDNTSEVLQLWESAVPAEKHPYMAKKGISGEACRVSGDLLLVPGYSVAGDLVSLERISSKGDKRHLGPKSGAFFPCGDLDSGETVYICEGMATAASVHQLTGLPAVAAFGTANLMTVAKALKGRDIMVCPDHDKAGKKAADECRAAGYRVIELPENSPSGADWNDLAVEQGIEAAKGLFQGQWSRAQAVKPSPDKKKRVFSLVKYGELVLTPPQFLVKGLIEKDTLSSLFGPSESGKSFIAVSLAASVASGLPFFGHDVEEGAVVYICGEGKNGIKRRLSAWEEYNGIYLKNSPLYISETAADFLDDGALEEVIAAIEQAGENPLLIVIDTLSRSFGSGDENSSQDMKKFIDSLDLLKALYHGAVILPVHHTGHAETGRARGSSVFRAALDSEFSVQKSGDAITLTATKTKDAARPQPLYFELEDVVLGETLEGDDFGSAALRRLDEAPAKGKKPLTPKQKAALDSFHRAAEAAGTLDEEGVFLGVHREAWRPFFYEISTADNPGSKRKAFQRIQDSLVEAGQLIYADDVFRLAGVEAGILENEYAKKLRLFKRDSGTGPGQNGTCPASGTGLAGQDGTNVFRHVPCPACVPPKNDREEENDEPINPSLVEDSSLAGTSPEGRAPKIPAPSGAFDGYVNFKDVTLEEAEVWGASIPGLMSELRERAEREYDPIMSKSPRDWYEKLIRIECAQARSVSEKTADVAGKTADAPGRDLTDDPPPRGPSLAEVAERAGVPSDVVREELERWQAAGRVSLGEDGSILLLAGNAFPEEGKPDEPDEEPEGVPSMDWLGEQSEEVKVYYSEQLKRVTIIGAAADPQARALELAWIYAQSIKAD